MGTTAAYVAGLIDGEGCIHIEKSRAGTASPSYRARVTVGMTAPAKHLLDELSSQWGGSVRPLRAATTRWAAAFQWYTWGVSAVQMLEYLLPYLRLKRDQAEVALEVERIRDALSRRANGNAIWTPEAREACEALKQRMHQLNRKGPAPTVEVV